MPEIYTLNTRLIMSWGYVAWDDILKGARKNGWKPKGTKLPKEKKWSGGYETNNGQTVSAVDAKNLARAILEWVFSDDHGWDQDKITRFIAFLKRTKGFKIY